VTREEALAYCAEALRRQKARDAAKAVRWHEQAPTTRQQEFLDLTCLEAMYGGAAGGGKSSALLIGALQYVNEPGYAALILRRTFADLALPGAIMDRSHDWLRGTAARWNGQDKTWTFPSGATLSFGYLDTEGDKFRYQGAELQCICFDELTQFSETQYTYLLSRLRRVAGSSIPLRARAASNPGGVGHRWVKRRFVDTATRGERRFVPAKLADNPHVDQESYREALAQLDSTTRAQLEQGLWVLDDGGLVYRYDPDRNLAASLPRGDWNYIWVCDFGTSEKTPTTAIAVLAFSWSQKAVYLVETRKLAAAIPSSIADEYRADKARYGAFFRTIGDQGGLGKGYIEEFRQRHAIPMEPADKADKLGFRKLMNGDLERGTLQIVAGSNDAWIDEANTLTWNERGTDCMPNQADHATDAALYGWRAARHWLAKEAEAKPEVGSTAYYDAEAKRMEREAIAALERRSRGDSTWWEMQ
jgi:hypothetical protein